MPTEFLQERRLFDEKLPEWLKTHRGWHVVIVKQDVVGLYPDLNEAVEAGLKRAGGSKFYCARVTERPPVAMMPFLLVPNAP